MEYVHKKVKAIEFNLLDPITIKKMAATKVVTPELYDKEGYPVDGGLMDVMMGVIDPGLRCKTCGGKLKECMGHFGYIELARPVIHIKYADIIYNFLRSTCRRCGKTLADEDKIHKHRELLSKIRQEGDIIKIEKAVNEFISSLRTKKVCPHCNEKQHTIKFDKPITFYEGDNKLNANHIKTRLESLKDEDIELLGLDPKSARPDWMILTSLPVPPVTVRPSITLETGERSEDDLTHKLGDIVRINQRLFENINAGAPEVIVEDLWDLLQYHIITYFDNSVPQVPPARHRSGQLLKTLHERIKSKEGRFRYNLAGKRVNYGSRAVISPDPKIKLNEVGVPRPVAMILTIPETVNTWNMDHLKTLIENGPHRYPGANYILRPNGIKKQITDETKQQLLEELEEGYIIERHLVDGDISIFNRQPSLHRMSLMCHRIRILPGNSFRLNPAVCNPYNADFDGDEMNLHIPQTEEARAEAEMLMEVQKHIIAPKHGENVIGCVQDAISGNYLLTKEITLNKKDAIQLLVSVGVYTPDRFKAFKNNVTGKEVFSCLLPRDFDFIGRAKDGKDVIIKNGNLLEGIIDKNTIGENGGSLIRSLYNIYEEDIGIDITGKIFRLGIAVLLINGFTTSTSDTDLSEKVRTNINEILDEAEKKAKKYIKQYEAEELTPIHGMSDKETVEFRILETLNTARNDIGKLIASKISDEKNPSIIMATSGAAGKTLALAQMAACVGQQAVRGRRVEHGYRTRTLSIFEEHDLSPESKGWIRRGYKEGLKPYEYFMHALTGRDSLMDSALRTPKSGYLYRRLANALQDLRIEYDGTVRDSNRNLIQFKYGDDGIDVSKSESGTINVKKIVKEVMNL